MSQINLQGLLNNISEKNTVYTPIIEAIVNSIQSIESSGRTDGVITVTIQRESQIVLDIEEASPKVKNIEIYDNGVGFTKENRDSFDTLYSDQKIEAGGKGFGRLMFLKYFEKVEVNSTYKEEEEYRQRTFTFSGKSKIVEDLIENEKDIKVDKTEIQTVISLDNLNEKYASQLNIKLDTIARKIVEKLLPYFINEKYKCPEIVLEEAGTNKRIILNRYFDEHEGIKKLSTKKFILTKRMPDGKEIKDEFEVIIFKIYFTQSTSSVVLTAHNRAVTSEPLHEYIPEFKDFFDEEIEKDDKTVVNKGYSIKAYVLGKYLNDNVSLEREEFKIPKESDLLHPYSRKQIEEEATKIVAEEFKNEVVTRQQKKFKKIKEYIEAKAPWYKNLLELLDISKIPFDFDEAYLEGELQKLKFAQEQHIKSKVTEILNKDESKISEKVAEIYPQINELGKSDLARYVVLRKAVLEVLKKSLRFNDDKRYEKEKVIHDLIFPMGSDSDSITYEQHNLWILDERLSFTEYIASDKPLNSRDERPDLLIFNRPIAIREGEDLSNPISIIEFKRPQREEYEEDDDPINQIGEYIEKIRKNNFKDIEGRTIRVNGNTPAYGYLICDFTEKIKKFCKRQQLTLSPDEQEYFGYHQGYRMYIQVISFDKLLNDAELRNKIFFKKLDLV